MWGFVAAIVEGIGRAFCAIFSTGKARETEVREQKPPSAVRRSDAELLGELGVQPKSGRDPGATDKN